VTKLTITYHSCLSLYINALTSLAIMQSFKMFGNFFYTDFLYTDRFFVWLVLLEYHNLPNFVWLLVLHMLQYYNLLNYTLKCSSVSILIIINHCLSVIIMFVVSVITWNAGLPNDGMFYARWPTNLLSKIFILKQVFFLLQVRVVCLMHERLQQ